MTSGHCMNFISLQYGTSVLGVEIVKLVKPHVCSVSNLCLLYPQYLMLFRFSYFELFKYPNSALRFINVGVSVHCVPSSTILYHIPPKLRKRNNHQNFANQYTKRHTNNKQFI